MKILYWNTHNEDNIEVITDLVLSVNADHIVFSEVKSNQKEISDELKKHQYSLLESYNQNTIHLTRYAIELYELVLIDNHINAVEYNTVIGPRIIIAGVHLPSKLYKDTMNQYDLSTEYIRKINEFELKYNNHNTIIIGDFNFAPYENAMIGHKAFHATMCKKMANTGSRIVDDVSKNFFYNPMWRIYGKYIDKLGTYYYRSSSSFEYYWYLFDQVIIRPSLIPYFIESSLEIVDKTSKFKLVKENDSTSFLYSDHLPILCEFDFLRREV